MANFDFPSSPSNGQSYSANGVTYTYNGTVWKRVTGATKGIKGEPSTVAGDKGQKGEVGAGGSGGDKGQKGATGATGSAASYTVKQVLSTSTNGTQYYRYYQGPIDTGLSLTINCADANNKILIEYTICCAATTGNSSFGGGRYVGSRLLRNNSQIASGSGGGSGNESVYTDTGHDSLDHHSFSYMDTPGAGNHTYKVQIRHHLSGSYSNYLVFNRSRSGAYRTLSTLTCSEIEI